MPAPAKAGRLIERTVVVVREAGQTSPAPVIDESEAEFMPGLATVTLERSPLGESPRQAAYREWWGPVLQMSFDDPDQSPPTLSAVNSGQRGLSPPKRRKRLELPTAHRQQQRISLQILLGQLLVGQVLLGEVVRHTLHPVQEGGCHAFAD